MKNQIEILENGEIIINNESANYDSLLSAIDPIGEYTTKENGTIVLFPFKNGFIEYLIDGSFESGKSANFTELSFEEIMEYYEIL